MSAAVAETVASNASRYGAQAWQAFKAKSKTAAKSAARGIRESSPSIKPTIRAPRQLTSHFGKTAGRNSAGHITIFHRGGGAKRLHRKIDLKRNTPSIGIIERIEYDPNRSARITLVRWEDTHPLIQRRSTAEGKFVPPQKSLEFTATTPRGVYSLASLSDEVGKNNVVETPRKLKGTYAMIGGETPELKRVYTEAPESMKACERDVFLSAFKAQRPGRKSDNLLIGSCLNFPRVTVAGAKPLYYGAQMNEKEGKDKLSMSEIQKWNNKSSVWAHRLKPKAAVSWHGFRMLDSLRFA